MAIKDSKTLMTGLVAGAVGAGYLMARKYRDNNKSSLEKIMDRIDKALPDR